MDDMDDRDFYQKHGADLLRLAVVITGPRYAEDVLSASVLKCLQAKVWPTLDSDERKRYAYRVVVNEGRLVLKRQGRVVERDSFYVDDRPCFDEPRLPSELLGHIATLSVRQRAVVFLTYWEDLDTRSVAQTLGISEGSVYQHLNRARTALRGKIDV